jgi:hypothetical protein
MVKIVYQTEDGGIFDTEEEAAKWETRDKELSDLADTVWANTSYIDRADIREVLEVVMAHYDITPK